MDSPASITKSDGAAGRLGLDRIAYRAGQFWASLFAVPGEQDLVDVSQVLSPSLMALFQTMQPGEQAHSLSIFRKLGVDGQRHPDLLAAALLHDVGKSRFPLRIWERVLIVLGRALFPEKSVLWGQGRPIGWKRAFVIAEQHAAWGAEMACLAGASPLAVALIRRHQEPVNRGTAQENLGLEDQLLGYLQKFDDES